MEMQQIVYFESSTLRGLYECIKAWQDAEYKQITSLNIEQENGKFSCIVISGPAEVIIVSADNSNCGANVTRSGYLEVDNHGL